MEMGLKKVIKYYLLGESLREIELNRILDKISKKSKLSDREKKFIELYNHTNEDKDSMYLSKNVTCDRVRKLLDNGKKVICDLHDRNGRIGLPILDIENDYNSNDCIVIMKGETHNLSDRFLYNIIYNVKQNKYSLQEQGEYYEKILIDNND